MKNPPRELPPMADVTEVQDESADAKEALEYDAETGTYRASFDSSADSVCWAITTMVAAISEREPMQLTSLGSVVDAEALDAVVNTQTADRSRNDVHVTLHYEGYEVTVHSYGIVAARPEQRNAADD